MAGGLRSRLTARIRRSGAYALLADVRQCIAARERIPRQCVSLPPHGPRVGDALLSYVLEPFLLPPGAPVPLSHTHFWESLTMAEVLRRLGYRVDVISYRNRRFVPDRPYDLLIDARTNLQRLAPLVGERCLKVLHIDTSHLLFQEAAEFRRLLALQRRRGATLRPRRLEPLNLAIEHADCATMLGNDATRETWAYAGKPIHALPMPSVVTFPPPTAKDFAACRHRFLWFGSYGLVHKGLDLVLEAFAGAPECELVVCGPVGREPDFERVYHRELYETPNIHTVGWVDVAGSAFRQILDGCVGTVLASASEGGCGSVITCMQAGLIPVVTRECGVDVSPDYGVMMRDDAVETIREAVRGIAALPPERLRSMAERAREVVLHDNSLEGYAAAYERALRRILADFGRPAAGVPAAGVPAAPAPPVAGAHAPAGAAV